MRGRILLFPPDECLEICLSGCLTVAIFPNSLNPKQARDALRFLLPISTIRAQEQNVYNLVRSSLTYHKSVQMHSRFVYGKTAQDHRESRIRPQRLAIRTKMRFSALCAAVKHRLMMPSGARRRS
ncbi:hypothetical protein EVAR_33699_1 [Eumeta japonica]|uniref:Uncharacterized protein n=1 Tax=Eumeta variegata TaxID=151549 RepID=A0A4C1VN44_EUMVA|nr:hypothetical protein EVAR_33699_1 [Eumeta japonica]